MGLDSRRLALAVAAAGALVLSAPFLGLIRSQLRAAFPGQFVWLVAALLGAAGAAAAVFAAVRIRDRRVARFTILAAALALGVVAARMNAADNRDSNVVEIFHFLQYGVVTFLFYRSFARIGDLSMLALPVLAGIVVGAAEEWFQWFLPARVGELRDLYVNLAAIACGLLFSLAVEPPDGFSRVLRPGSAQRMGRYAAVAILALGCFIDVVHLGHRIADDEAGLFESRYDRDRLVALASEKAREWTVRPPPARLRRVSREDQYLTEAIQHAQQRNVQWAAGDILGAWSENRILEKYYTPALAIRWYAAPEGLAWPDAQRADAETRAAGARAANPARIYVSDAYPYPIFVWPRGIFLGVVMASAAFVVFAGASVERARNSFAARSEMKS